MLSPPVSAKSIRIPIKHLPQTNTATTGLAVELVLTSQHRPGQSSAFNYFSVSGFCIPACSLCRSFLCLLVFGSIWTAKWSFAPSFAKSAAAEGCVTAAAADGSKQPNAAEALAPPSQPGLFLALSVWVVFFLKRYGPEWPQFSGAQYKLQARGKQMWKDTKTRGQNNTSLRYVTQGITCISTVSGYGPNSGIGSV